MLAENTGMFIPLRTRSLFHQHFIISSIRRAFGGLPSGIVPFILWIRSPIVSAAAISAVWPAADEDTRKSSSRLAQSFIPVVLFPDRKLYFSRIYSSPQMGTILDPEFKEVIKVNPFQ